MNMPFRHFIVTVIPTKKPHRVEQIKATNSKNDIDTLMSEMRTRLLADDVMAINILRDCHDDSTKQDE